MQLEVVLVVVGHDLQQKEHPHYLLTSANLLPNAPLTEEKSSLDIAQQLLMDYTGLSALVAGVGWISLQQLPVVDDVNKVVNGKRTITIPYFCTVPLETSVCGTWAPIVGEVKPSSIDHLEILVSAWNAL